MIWVIQMQMGGWLVGGWEAVDGGCRRVSVSVHDGAHVAPTILGPSCVLNSTDWLAGCAVERVSARTRRLRAVSGRGSK